MIKSKKVVSKNNEDVQSTANPQPRFPLQKNPSIDHESACFKRHVKNMKLLERSGTTLVFWKAVQNFVPKGMRLNTRINIMELTSNITGSTPGKS